MDNKRYAVLTGDIVDSSKMAVDDLFRVQTHFKEQLDLFHPDWLAAAPSFYRGDGWQLAVNQECYALRIALFALCVFRSCAAATRVAVGIGPVERLIVENIATSAGEAFTLSGRLLDRMEAVKVAPRRPFLDLATTPENPYRSFAFRSVGAIVSAWTPRHARLGIEILQAKSHEGIARDTGLSRNSISRSLARMDWARIDELLNLEENTI